MPGWQQFYEQHRAKGLTTPVRGFELVSVAVDVQGAEKARPWVKKASATFTSLVDREAALGAMFGLNFVPFSILIDETGKIVRGPKMVDVARESHRQEIADWIVHDRVPSLPVDRTDRDRVVAFANDETKLHLARAVLLLERGDTSAAAADLKHARRLDQGNWLIRKQIWAIEHPDRFYDGPVDFSWQRRQIEDEDRSEGS